MSANNLLEVHNLRVRFATQDGEVEAVNGVNFSLAPGETLGIVGESGSGKSQTVLAIMGLLAGNGQASGKVVFSGKDLLTLGKRELNAVRGANIGMIFQDPMTSLNPFLRISTQLTESLVAHRGMSKKEALARAIEVLDAVHIPDAKNRVHYYPHEFSGGQWQRIGIARALVVEPKLLLCDEPVSALDVSIQAQIVNLLMDLQKEMGLALLFIAHDLSVVRHISDRVMVMYLGKTMELADRDTLYSQPQHPYTQALIGAVPIPDPVREREKEVTLLSGELPSPLSPPSGCVFRTRCPIAQEVCAQSVPVLKPAERSPAAVACKFA